LFYSTKQPFDLVICDWLMPEMSGIDLLKKIRDAGSDVPFLMLTVKTERESVMKAAKAGVTGYITKPFDLKGIQSRIRAVARKIIADDGA